MAVTPDLSGNNPTDVQWTTPNRNVTGTPNGVVTPLYAGEIVFDTVNIALWRAQSTTNTSWVGLVYEI